MGTRDVLDGVVMGHVFGRGAVRFAEHFSVDNRLAHFNLQLVWAWGPAVLQARSGFVLQAVAPMSTRRRARFSSSASRKRRSVSVSR